MGKLFEQYTRFEEVLKAKENYSMNCDKCPIRKACESAFEGVSIEEVENLEPCEKVLFDYILTGQTPNL